MNNIYKMRFKNVQPNSLTIWLIENLILIELIHHQLVIYSVSNNDIFILIVYIVYYSFILLIPEQFNNSLYFL